MVENEKSAATQTTTGNTDSNNNVQQKSGNKQNNNHNNRRRVNNNRNSVQLMNNITWEGENSEVNGVVGMQIENFHQKVPFETFKDKIINYAISNYKNSEDMKPIFQKCSINAMTIKHKHRPLAKTTDQIENEIQREQIKSRLQGIHTEKQYGKTVRSFMGTIQVGITSHHQENKRI